MSGKQCHEICFRDVPNDWDSALPIGNGRMGAMVFLQKNVLHIAMNHYDCYYHVLPGRNFQDPARFVETFEELCGRADAVRNQGDAERSHYVRTLHPMQETKRPSYGGVSYPMGGELLLIMDESVDIQKSCLRLKVEEAVITFEAGRDGACVTAELLAAREMDGVLLRLTQTRDGLWESGSLVIPSAVGIDEDGESEFTQELVFCLEEPGRAIGSRQPGCLDLGGAGNLFYAALALQPGEGKAGKLAGMLVKEANTARRRHQIYWEQFWTSSVRLPDALLEKLWHLQLYLMECSCGRGSGYPEQVCGLNGLWDIRRPDMWGSMWYWDVNIQSTFWGSGCAGHPELLKLFCDGYLSYEQDIREYTRQVYHIEGWALDYPHPLYHCIQPWCAQFLWQYYQYSGDEKFLEEKAYPVFREQIAFFKKLSEQDEQGIRHVRYDISPEQGPVTEDSVITISCVRKLVKMAVESGKLLNRPEEEIEEMRAVLKELPPYPLTADGSRYKDSLLVQDHIFLRHPSMLMPLFPAEEAGADSEEEEVTRWERTLRYAAGHTETGTFGMGWLAAAAARLGRGRTALRLIYENGLDYILHTNGLAYEESERFLNYCHVTKPAHYLPVMMESAGGLVNAVNQMLLQIGKDGEIHVFPAVPDETADLLEKTVQYQEDDHAVEGWYDNWEDVSFAGLLAPEGFRVSAARKGGATVFLKIESSREAVLRLALPEELSESGSSHVLERKMKAGEVFCLGQEMDEETPDTKSEVLCHEAARTHRRIFLGANRHTPYYQAIDAFTCAYLIADDYRFAQTPYIFDFGTGKGEKDYDDSYPRQIAMAGQCVLYAAGPRRISAEEYRPDIGYGFLNKSGIHALDRGGPDALRRDLLEGTQEAVFVLSLPKGKYDLLLICGDEKEASCTKIGLPRHGTAVCTGKLAAGNFGCKTLPVVQEQDGKLQIRLEAGEQFKWKLNAMFVNKERGGTF